MTETRMIKDARRFVGPSTAKPFSSHPIRLDGLFLFFWGAWVHPHYITLALSGLELQPGYLKPINARFSSPKPTPPTHPPLFIL